MFAHQTPAILRRTIRPGFISLFIFQAILKHKSTIHKVTIRPSSLHQFSFSRFTDCWNSLTWKLPPWTKRIPSPWYTPSMQDDDYIWSGQAVVTVFEVPNIFSFVIRIFICSLSFKQTIHHIPFVLSNQRNRHDLSATFINSYYMYGVGVLKFFLVCVCVTTVVWCVKLPAGKEPVFRKIVQLFLFTTVEHVFC